MKDWEKELTQKYKGKTIGSIPQEVRYDENYGYFFIYRNHIFIANLDSDTKKIVNIKYAKLIRRY